MISNKTNIGDPRKLKFKADQMSSVELKQLLNKCQENKRTKLVN